MRWLFSHNNSKKNSCGFTLVRKMWGKDTDRYQNFFPMS
jgi:hypothetical protein